MLRWRQRQACRRPLYSGTPARRLCRRRRGPGAAAAVVSAALSCGLAGCSFQLNSLLAKDEIDAAQTGSIAGAGDPTGRTAEAAAPAEADLAYARAAASDAMARSGKDVSVPWQNPATGASGNITPLGTVYGEGGLPCRDFLASYQHGGAQDWLQGAACRTGAGTWDVKSLKPLKSS